MEDEIIRFVGPVAIRRDGNGIEYADGPVPDPPICPACGGRLDEWEGQLDSGDWDCMQWIGCRACGIAWMLPPAPQTPRGVPATSLPSASPIPTDCPF